MWCRTVEGEREETGQGGHSWDTNDRLTRERDWRNFVTSLSNSSVTGSE